MGPGRESWRRQLALHLQDEQGECERFDTNLLEQDRLVESDHPATEPVEPASIRDGHCSNAIDKLADKVVS